MKRKRPLRLTVAIACSIDAAVAFIRRTGELPTSTGMEDAILLYTMGRDATFRRAISRRAVTRRAIEGWVRRNYGHPGDIIAHLETPA